MTNKPTINRSTIISNTLASKIVHCADLYARAIRIESQIEEELYELGFDMEKLFSGNGNGFE
jgi:hypothetical protein